MRDVPEGQVVAEGPASRAAGLVVATIAVIVFGCLGTGAMLLPEDAGLFRWIAGGICFALAGAAYPWQILDVASRKHVLTDTSVIYRTGVISTFEIEVPYSKIESVSVRQGPLQRLLGCGDVRIAAPGAGGPLVVTPADYSSVCMRSIPDFEEISSALRMKTREIEKSRIERRGEANAVS